MIVVVGCGVAGLTCAVLLAEAGHPVEIWAASVPPHTTSNVAAAFWYPYQAFPRARVLGWAQVSYRRFRALAGQPGTGVTTHRLLDLYRDEIEQPWWAEAVPEYTRLPDAERPVGFASGFAFTSAVIDTRRYLPYLRRRFERSGGRVVLRRLASLDEALEEAAVVFNCSGLGARTLAPDPEVYPIRGQLLHVDDPGVEGILLDEHGSSGLAYVVPRGDHCVLGGTAEPEVDDVAVRAKEDDGIVERCARLDPRLASASRRASVVGLRPGRATVRVEAQPHARGTIIHDYGHGGAGVTLSWGCAVEAISLGRSVIDAPARRQLA